MILYICICHVLYSVYDGVRRVSGLRKEPVVSVEFRVQNARTELATRWSESATKGSESTTKGSESSFSVGCGDQCGVLYGDYRFAT